MRTALVTDIHGNLGGFRAVLDDIDGQRVDRILCLGDVVDGGGEDSAVIKLLRDAATPCIGGNHDANNDLRLSDDETRWLAELPPLIEEGGIVFAHARPTGEMRYVRNGPDAWNAFESRAFRVAFVGHTHVPAIWRHDGGRGCEARLCEFAWKKPFPFDQGERYIVCVGAVAYSRDFVRRNRYAIYDSEADAVEMRSVKGPVIEGRYWF